MLLNDGQLISVKGHCCPTERDLCYRPSNPSLPLNLLPFQFLAAQIPGLRPQDHNFLSWIDRQNPRPGLVLLDIVASQRLFLNSLEILRNQIIPRAKDFPILNGQFMLALTFLSMCHRKWLNAIEIEMKERETTDFGGVILAFGEVSEIQGAEREYEKQLAAVAAVVREASLKYSQLFVKKLRGETIAQAVAGPGKWMAKMTEAARRMLAAFQRADSLTEEARAVLAGWAKNGTPK
jgi:hypothetical protein